MLRDLFHRLIARWCGGRGPDGGGLGSKGEQAAAAHLRRESGLVVVQRNWRHGRDEVDLICRDGEVLVFVEVKTRAAHSLVSGYHAVNQRKKRALLRVCRAYIAQLAEKPRTFRFDIVEVEHRDGVMTEIRHFTNVPLFAKGYRPGA